MSLLFNGRAVIQIFIFRPGILQTKAGVIRVRIKGMQEGGELLACDNTAWKA